MITPVCQTSWTDEAIMALPQNGKRYELRKGELVIYRESMRFAILHGNSFLTGHDVLPGFRYSLRPLFADPAF
jgi:hypothetical protein